DYYCQVFDASVALF
nr:immunoglobulin light chain junction region [Macaca mulatta]